LTKAIELVLSLLLLVRVVVDACKLVEDCIVVIGRLVGLRQLRKHHSLNVGVKVEVDVVELRGSVTNCFAINL